MKRMIMKPVLAVFALGALLLPSMTSAMTMKAYRFSDTSGSLYEEAITYLGEFGIVQGYEDFTYKPKKTINRAEFIKIVIAANYKDELESGSYNINCFSDITNNKEWYVPYACLAKEKGIIQGYEGKYLRPANTINVVEAAKIIANVYGGASSDGDDVWYRPYIQYLIGQKFWPQTLTKADQLVTRGDMAEMIARAMKAHKGRLDEHLTERKNRYGEEQKLVWNDFVPKVEEPIKEEPSVPNNGERIRAEIISGEHPGNYVGGGYLSTYAQWTNANYDPNVNNNSLSLEKENQLRAELLNLLNAERSKAGKGTFTHHDMLHYEAQWFAEHLVVNAFYGHMDKMGRDPFDRLANYDGWVAESIVWRKSGPSAAVNWWKNSDLHWNNIMDGRHAHVGIGIVEEPNGGYIIVLLTGE